MAIFLLIIWNKQTLLAEYSMEIVNLILRAKTTATHTNDQISEMAGKIEACKYEFHEFIPSFVPAHHYCFKSARIKSLQYKLQSFKLRR